MDVRLTVLVALYEKLGIRGHAEVAAAFLAASMELFVNETPRLGGKS